MRNKLLSFAASALVLSAIPAGASDTYALDAGHTEVFFGWSHAGVSRQHGEFDKVSGTLKIDPSDIESAVLNVSIETASVSTGVPALDKHLVAHDYLDADAHPTISFVSTSVENTGDTTADVTGDLTINGVTKSVTLATTLTHSGPHPVGKFFDYYKGDWLAFAAETTIDHMAFGVGSFSTGPIAITISTELKRQ